MSPHINFSTGVNKAPLRPTDVDQSPLAPTDEPKSSPSPAELQANIAKGIQQTAQNLDQILGAVAGNTNLAPVDVQIKELLEAIQNKRDNEAQIQDASRNEQEAGNTQLQDAAQKLEEITGAVTGDPGGR